MVDENLARVMEKLSEISVQISETRKDIQSAVTPKFLDVSIQTNDLIELAVEMWRLENRLKRVLSVLPQNQQETFNNSIAKLKRYLDKNDVEIVDYTNQKFNGGLNLEILTVEKNPAVSETTVKETKEPTIKYKGQVVRKGKVVLLEKGSSELPKGSK